MVDVNRILKGKDGEMWFNGQLLASLKKIEAKVKGDFEDINLCGDPSTHSVYNGWSGEGSFICLKIDSTVWKLVAEAYKTGVMPPIKIITRLTDKSTGQSERAAIEGITITEFALASFEAKKMLEEEYPFKFSDYEILESIA
ncbi:phage-like element PBSX protein XkdM [Clostridium puniceum]|uniref:Phage-like element PBSX protein XkdM n=1 Tax=Clostridium puniceum TaxID=29367 RepID=A0A1S8TW34_9CLOT|nr:phage tail tube protein [Clostridium puniceum]OOM81792.1 phage-like element PBSX protein XkdM [Clostridium puniceum]